MSALPPVRDPSLVAAVVRAFRDAERRREYDARGVEPAPALAELKPEPPPRPEPTGVVYFVSHGDTGPIKVGFTKSLPERVVGLQTGTPHLVVVVHSMPGTRALEQRIHQALERHCIRGEWFERDAVLAWIKEHA